VGYLALTDSDRQEMLETIGVSSIDELFVDIPDRLRFGRTLDVPPALSEQELVEHLAELASRNVHTGVELSFLGAGIYDHYVPAVVDAVLSRGELLTAYTPYQPEMSQGVLQAIFEYQTAICELTGLDVSNASGYDGTTVARRRLLHRQARNGAFARRASRDRQSAGAPGGQDLRPRLRARGRRGSPTSWRDRP
jgi:glycine dehydrogenase subunit 1